MTKPKSQITQENVGVAFIDADGCYWILQKIKDGQEGQDG